MIPPLSVNAERGFHSAVPGQLIDYFLSSGGNDPVEKDIYVLDRVVIDRFHLFVEAERNMFDTVDSIRPEKGDVLRAEVPNRLRRLHNRNFTLIQHQPVLMLPR